MAGVNAVGAAFGLYLVVTWTLGWLAYRRTHNLSDYILGGRRLGRWVAALSAGASDMSGWLLMGLPGYAYLAGTEAGWLALGLLAGTYLNWRLMARRLRAYTLALDDALTLPDFLERRFDDRRRVLRIVSAACILLFFLFYTSSGLVAAGKLFATVFDLPYHWAVIVGTLAIILYTFLGGFLAVSWTDVIQGLLMAAALTAVPVAAVAALGGAETVLTGLGARPDLLDPLQGADGAPLGAIVVLSLLGWGLGYFGQPHILARFKATRSERELTAARRIAVGWTALCLLGATLVGLTGAVYLPEALVGGESEKVFMLLAGALFHPVVAGVLLAAILAAIMSIADSQLLVASSSLAQDFYKGLLRPGAGQTELMTVGRAGVVLIAALAALLALDPEARVLELVAYAWAGFGAAFGPVLLLALYWPRANAAGALAGMLAGAATVVAWRQLEGGVFDLYELIPGFAAGLAAAVAVSLLTPAPAPQLTARHRAVLERR